MKVEEQNEMKNQKSRARNEINTSSTQQEIEYRDDNAHREINFV